MVLETDVDNEANEAPDYDSVELLVTNLPQGNDMHRQMENIISQARLPDFDKMNITVVTPVADRGAKRDYLWIRDTSVPNLNTLRNHLLNLGIRTIWSPQANLDRSRTFTVDIRPLGLQQGLTDPNEAEIVSTIRRHIEAAGLTIYSSYMAPRKDSVVFSVDNHSLIEPLCNSTIQYGQTFLEIRPPGAILPSRPFEIVVEEYPGFLRKRVIEANFAEPPLISKVKGNCYTAVARDTSHRDSLITEYNARHGPLTGTGAKATYDRNMESFSARRNRTPNGMGQESTQEIAALLKNTTASFNQRLDEERKENRQLFLAERERTMERQEQLTLEVKYMLESSNLRQQRNLQMMQKLTQLGQRNALIQTKLLLAKDGDPRTCYRSKTKLMRK